MKKSLKSLFCVQLIHIIHKVFILSACLVLIFFLNDTVNSQTLTDQDQTIKSDDGKIKEDTDTANTGSKKKNRRTKSDEIVVKGDIFKYSSSAYTVNVIDSDKIKELGVSEAANIIKAVPGVVMKEYGQGFVSNAVTLRGFTSGVHGDDMGIYLDGIPLNETMGHGGGYADPNIIIPLEIDNIMVYKGPSTAMFGNFSKAGTMAFYTRKKGEYDLMSMKFGSFKTTDLEVALGEKISDNVWNNTAAQYYSTDGYIENTSSLMGNASTRFTFIPVKDLEISIALRAHGAIWDGSGYITRDQFENRDTAFDQRPNAENNGGNRNQFCERIDLDYQILNNLKLNVWGFGSETDWERWSKSIKANPADEKQQDQDYFVYKAGSGLNLNYTDRLLRIISGIEYYSDGTEYNEYYSIERVRQNKTQKYDNRLDNYVFFTEGEAEIHPLFRPTAGIRVDSFRGNLNYDIKSSVAVDENHSFGFSKYTHVSPKFGFRSTLIDEILDLRLNICNGYVMPKNLSIFVVDDIKPSNMWQYEIGTTITKTNIFWFDAAVFIIDTKNEIQADPTDSGNYYKYTNMGETRRLGSEVSAKITPVRSIEFNGNFSYISTDIRKNRNSSYEGKSLSGLPEYSAQAGFKAETPMGFGVKSDWVYVGKSYLNSTNTESYNGYNLLNAGIYYKLIFENNDIDFSFEVKNVFNKLYASTYSANDAGTVTSFSPGMPRSYYGSVNMRW